MWFDVHMYDYINTVLKGEYKGCDIKKGEIICADKIKLSPENVASYTIIDKSLSPHSGGGATIIMNYLLDIRWKNGKKSLIYVDTDNYLLLTIEMY